MDATAPGSTNTRWLAPASDGAAFAFCATTVEAGARFFMKASDLGTYLFYDDDGQYLVAEDNQLARQSELSSDLLLLDDTYVSPAEWQLEVSTHDPDRFQLRNYQTGRYLTTTGTTEDLAEAAVIALYPTTGCAAFPELTVDADGAVVPRRWDDGAVYGFVDAHSHMFTNFGFGGGGIFHGAPFHRLGVEHALPSCERFHGDEGRSDLVGYAFSGLGELDTTAMLTALVSGMTPTFDHHPEGYPAFTDWPNSWKRATHQTQYYLS